MKKDYGHLNIGGLEFEPYPLDNRDSTKVLSRKIKFTCLTQIQVPYEDNGETVPYTVNELELYIISMDEFNKYRVDQKNRSQKNTYSMRPLT